MRKRRAGKLCLFGFIVILAAVFGNFPEKPQAQEAGEKVDIVLREYQKGENGEQSWENPSLVLPGQCISKIPRISNRGMDCYVRVRLAFRGSSEMELSAVQGMGTDWIQKEDGCFYYQKVLPSGETVELFHSVSIPETLSQTWEETDFYLDVEAEAIAEDAIEPDFQLEYPWPGVTSEDERLVRTQLVKTGDEEDVMFGMELFGGGVGILLFLWIEKMVTENGKKKKEGQ